MDDVSTQERIAIVDLADDLQVRKQRIFKILSRLSITPTQRREPSRGNQNVATVSPGEAAAIRAEILKSSDAANGPSSGTVGSSYSEDVGYFYVVQLEPEHDPGRFKVGFTMDLDGRLQKLRCAAPFARYLNSWPCRRVWERAAIDCVADGCERLHTDVFRAQHVEQLRDRAGAIFAMMPKLELEATDESRSEIAGVRGAVLCASRRSQRASGNPVAVQTRQ